MAKVSTTHKFKKDRYSRDRGGNSQFLDLYCSNCNQHILLYQKDGPGSLMRLYLDRIFDPQELSVLQTNCKTKSDVPNLTCPNCKQLVATPMDQLDLSVVVNDLAALVDEIETTKINKIVKNLEGFILDYICFWFRFKSIAVIHQFILAF